ncbi:putative T7SS-secreted protein [Streptomyces sp. MI02-7b]|uniref:putative T7SS-secreted protein n=1 Tax=Streptomyces sp. MI02-7b TaxID=462941 RepID=UPI0029B8FB82|nr:hypothetical protein [Streptomyces sp. MI02-7b]MDX3077925.1 hypothetical protein [Streptomyces sp. MI02-7b]
MTTQTYDALGFDPAPGVPASVAQLVTTLSRVGNQLNEAHGTLTRLGKSDGIWEGDAADGFAKKVGELPKYLIDGYGSLIDAAHALHRWQSQLTDFQTLAARYEAEAEQARRALASAQSAPDLRLAGRTFDTDAALQDAQRRLDFAVNQVNEATDGLNTVIKKAQDLLSDHEAAARAAAEAIRKAAERAPDEPGLFDRFLDSLKDLGDRIKDLAADVLDWLKNNADLLYKIGDWLGYASAACDVLAVVFSETIVGAVVFEAIGMVLNAGALAFHAGGWALGAKDGSWLDIGLDIVGFVPFGDLARGGKVAVGALKGVKIPMNVLDFGAKAADSWKRAGDLIDAVGGTAKFGEDAEKWVARNWNSLGNKAHAIHVTADKFADRFALAVAKEFGDSTLYRAGTSLLDAPFRKIMPELIERTPLSRIPALADSVRPVVDEAGTVVGKYIDPRSWTARGYEAAMGAKDLYKEGVRHVTEDVQYTSDKVHESIDRARSTAGRIVDTINPFG